MARKSKKTIIDLFCGAGGLSLGFENAGFEVVLANDIDESSIETFRKNHPHIPADDIVLGDIGEFTKDKRKTLEEKSFSVVVGGPPCQGFSMANRQRLISDPRNALYKKFVEVIGLAQPAFFVMENVKGMLPFASQVVDDFKAVGYISDFRLFNAKAFGIPQNRERLIYIGIREDVSKTPDVIIAKIFRDIENNKVSYQLPLKDALWGLRKLTARKKRGDTSIESSESGFTEDQVFDKAAPNEYIMRINHGKIPKTIYNHKARYNNERDLEIFRLLPPGEKSDHESIQHIMPYKSRAHIFKDKYYKLHPDKPSKTITSHMKFDCNMYIHPSEARGITPREAARIQSFPDDYIFKGSYTRWYAQIGNAVPPLLGEIIAKSIMKQIT
jgi:DNA (cytosine-5)-methyltransferase 1